MTAVNIWGARCVTLDRCFEFVAPTPLLAHLSDTLPTVPGAVLRSGEGHAQLLHFAPHRWLVPAPMEPLYRNLAARDLAGEGALVDVEGKWQAFRWEGRESVRLLESSVNVELLLLHRACSAVALFDCPAILARDGGVFDCWVRSSYAETFELAMARLSASLGVSGSDIASTPQPVI